MRRALALLLLLFAPSLHADGQPFHVSDPAVQGNFEDIYHKFSHISGQKAVGSFTSSASTGTQSVTGLRFRPSLVFIMVTWQPGGGPTQHGWGAMDSSGNQWAIGLHNLDSNNNPFFSVSDSVVKVPSSSGGIALRGVYSSMDEGGFTISWTSATAQTHHYIALE